jgi:hypothetical protein
MKIEPQQLDHGCHGPLAFARDLFYEPFQDVVSTAAFMLCDEAEQRSVVNEVFPARLRAVIRRHEFGRIPAREGRALGRSSVIDSTGVLLVIIEETARQALLVLTDLDHFLRHDLEATFDIVPDDFTLSDRINESTRYGSTAYQRDIFFLERWA